MKINISYRESDKFFYKVFVTYIKMSRNLSAKDFQEIKGKLHKKSVK